MQQKKENTPKILTAFVSKISNFSHSLKCSILQHFIILFIFISTGKTCQKSFKIFSLISFFCMLKNLRILTGKTHRQIKLKRFRKVRIYIFG